MLCSATRTSNSIILRRSLPSSIKTSRSVGTYRTSEKVQFIINESNEFAEVTTQGVTFFITGFVILGLSATLLVPVRDSASQFLRFLERSSLLGEARKGLKQKAKSMQKPESVFSYADNIWS